MDCDGKSDSSPEREAADDDTKVAEGADGIKKRKRKPYRPGRMNTLYYCVTYFKAFFCITKNIQKKYRNTNCSKLSVDFGIVSCYD